MPVGTLVVLVGVCLAFLLFGFVVAWADHTTSQWLRNKVDAEQASKPADEPGQRAA